MRKAAEVEVGETEAWGSACGGDTGLQVSRARRKESVNAARWIGPAGFAAPHWLAHQRWLTAFVFRSNFVNLQWEGQPSRRTIQTSAEKKHWIQTKNSFSLSLNYFCCPTSAPFPFILCYFFIFIFLQLWFPKWLRSGVAAPRPRRIRRLESLHREEAESELRPHRGLQRAVASRGWCDWRRNCSCSWDFFSLPCTSRCCGAIRFPKGM